MKKHSQEWLEARPFVTVAIGMILFMRYYTGRGEAVSDMERCMALAQMWIVRLEQEWPDR